MSEINWQDDEAVVRAAVPDARFSFAGFQWSRGIFSNDLLLSVREGWLYLGKKSKRNKGCRVWSCARCNPIVKAFEKANNPSFETVVEVRRRSEQ